MLRSSLALQTDSSALIVIVEKTRSIYTGWSNPICIGYIKLYVPITTLTKKKYICLVYSERENKYLSGIEKPSNREC